MVSNSKDVTESSSSHHHPQIPEKGTISTSTGEKRVRCLSTQAKGGIFVLGIGVIAGMIVVSLAAAHIFGSIGSKGFFASVGGGGFLTVASVVGIVWIAVANCQKEREPRQERRRLQENSPLDEVIKFLQEGKDISEDLKGIDKSFFEEKSQQRAKKTFAEVMKEVQGSEVSFPTACSLKDPDSLKGTLDPDVFQLSTTYGVQGDIPAASKDKESLHLFQVASQYNCAEAADVYTPKIGEAMTSSAEDYTQGPLAQRTNPNAFELVTAFLTHLGFNMLDKALPSAGKTYEVGSSIEHGYLCPDDENIKKLTEEFKKNFSQAEYVCYSSHSKNWKGENSVYLLLQAAPAIGYSALGDSEEVIEVSAELQKYAALANYLALFKHGVELAKTKQKKVVLHATAVGGGVFGNEEENLRWGFEKAALFFQKEMKDANISVRLESYKGQDLVSQIAQNLSIENKAQKMREKLISDCKKLYEQGQEGWIFVPHRVELLKGEKPVFGVGSPSYTDSGRFKIHISIDPTQMEEALPTILETLYAEDAPIVRLKFQTKKQLLKDHQIGKEFALIFSKETEENESQTKTVENLLKLLHHRLRLNSISPEKGMVLTLNNFEEIKKLPDGEQPCEKANLRLRKFDRQIPGSKYFYYRYEDVVLIDDEQKWIKEQASQEQQKSIRLFSEVDAMILTDPQNIHNPLKFSDPYENMKLSP